MPSPVMPCCDYSTTKTSRCTSTVAQVKALTGHTVQFINVSLDKADVLRVGENALAIHCRQSGGGQGIDVGVVELKH